MSNQSITILCADVPPPKFLSIFTLSMSVGITLVTIPGNSLLCLAILKDPFHELRTPFILFILSLAITDLLVGILVDPVMIMFHLSETFGIHLVGIQIVHIFYFILSTASILFLGALAIDRYVAVIHPLKYKHYLSSKKCVFLTLVIWLVSIGLSNLYFEFGYLYYSLIFASTAVLLTFLVLLFVYISTYKRLNSQVKLWNNRTSSDTIANRINTKKLSRLKWEKKVMKALTIVLLVFIFCFAPACVIIYILNLCRKCSCEFIHWLRDLELVIVLSNSAINPFLYAWRMPQFKKVLFKYCKWFKPKNTHSSYNAAKTSSKMDYNLKMDSIKEKTQSLKQEEEEQQEEHCGEVGEREQGEQGEREQEQREQREQEQEEQKH